MPMRDVVFHQVAEWDREDIGPRCVWVWIAFDDRLVATGEHEGPDDHAGVWSASAFLDTWAGRLDDPAARWLTPHVHGMARGEDVREAVLAGYVERHGHPPTTTVWNLPARRSVPSEAEGA
ncbi:hypothetical protein GTR02_08620 [Kineococcus sp. R8]|uniref:hypothetical protein n=1 Tax=Kineococcus siccus TaxID=2696567 RepID=UPI0014135073|nr:hypothetical protein [Kineococcus siccus]NAZ81881.1 hypothetical protein [Kineococcus siccus]